jgi:uncharacterized protein YfcZ (UPF0381/DUF406 family)
MVTSITSDGKGTEAVVEPATVRYTAAPSDKAVRLDVAFTFVEDGVQRQGTTQIRIDVD